jgi:hypothetical protein
MERTFTVKYTKDLVDYSVVKYFRYQIDWRFLLSIAGLFGLVAYLFFAGDRTWLFGFALACSLGSILFVVFAYFRIRNGALEKFRRMPSLQATFTLSDRGLEVASEYGSSEIYWSSIERILQYPRAWLFVIRGAGYFTMPIDEVDVETQQYILGKTNGKQVNHSS